MELKGIPLDNEKNPSRPNADGAYEPLPGLGLLLYADVLEVSISQPGNQILECQRPSRKEKAMCKQQDSWSSTVLRLDTRKVPRDNS